MRYDDGNKTQDMSIHGIKKKRCIAPRAHAIFTESVNLLGAYGPWAGVADIRYGGEIDTGDMDDQ